MLTVCLALFIHHSRKRTRSENTVLHVIQRRVRKRGAYEFA